MFTIDQAIAMRSALDVGGERRSLIESWNTSFILKKPSNSKYETVEVPIWKYYDISFYAFLIAIFIFLAIIFAFCLTGRIFFVYCRFLKHKQSLRQGTCPPINSQHSPVYNNTTFIWYQLSKVTMLDDFVLERLEQEFLQLNGRELAWIKESVTQQHEHCSHVRISKNRSGRNH